MWWGVSGGLIGTELAPTYLLSHEVVVCPAEVMGCQRRHPPAAVPPARVGGSGGGWGVWRDFQTTQTSSNFCTFLRLSLESHGFQHPSLKESTNVWVAWLGPWPLQTSLPCPVLQVGAGGSPRPGSCVAARGAEGLPSGQGGRKAAAGTLTVHRPRRALCTASVGVSPPSGRPGPDRLGR